MYPPLQWRYFTSIDKKTITSSFFVNTRLLYNVKMNQTSQTTTAKLPILKIFGHAVSLTVKRFPALLRLGAPFIFCSLLDSIFFREIFNTEKNFDITMIIGLILLSVAMILTGIMAAVGCHRVFLMNSEDVKETKMLRYLGREARFLVWGIIYYLFSFIGFSIMPLINYCIEQYLVSAPAPKDPNFLIYFRFLWEQYNELYSFLLLIFPFLFSYVIARCSMVFPATAIDKRDKTLVWSWHLTVGNGWRLALLLYILPYTISYLANMLPEIDSVIYNFFLGVAWLVIGAVLIGFLSLSYSFLCQSEAVDDSKNPLKSPVSQNNRPTPSGGMKI